VITVPGLITRDFADGRAIMSEGGAALMAVGVASGDDRARKAAELAISSALLDVTIDGARGILFNVTGGPDMSLFEVNEAAQIIKETAHQDVQLIFGAVVDENMRDQIRITVIATGFERGSAPIRPAKNTATDWRSNVVANRQMHQPVQNTPPVRQAAPPPAQEPARPAPPPEPRDQSREQPPARPQQSANTQQPNAYVGDDLDIPAFLRKNK
jgi:cell division protein FtsZ